LLCTPKHWTFELFFGLLYLVPKQREAWTEYPKRLPQLIKSVLHLDSFRFGQDSATIAGQFQEHTFLLTMISPSLYIQEFILSRSYNLIPPGRLPRLSLLCARHNLMRRHVLHLHQFFHSQNFSSDLRRMREIHGLEPPVDTECEKGSFDFVPEGDGRPSEGDFKVCVWGWVEEFWSGCGGLYLG